MSIFEASCFPEKTFKLFFNYRYVNISKSVVDTWNSSEYNKYIKMYKLRVDPSVLNNSSDEMRELLCELNSDEDPIVNMTHPIHKSGCWFRAMFSLSAISIFKKIFISTLVYHYQNQQLPNPESITFSFDTDKETVTITRLNVYVPTGNPYYLYARNAAVLMSAEAIGLSAYQGDEKIRDFYDVSRITQWRNRIKLEKEPAAANCPGVYMLYDETTNQIYVGKAIRLIDRIIQHTKTPGDTMMNFTHYRYSGISEEYVEFLYLIENASIHDLAWILEMPKAKKYKSALAQIAGNSIEKCTLSNTIEHQTRKQ